MKVDSVPISGLQDILEIRLYWKTSYNMDSLFVNFLLKCRHVKYQNNMSNIMGITTTLSDILSTTVLVHPDFNKISVNVCHMQCCQNNCLGLSSRPTRDYLTGDNVMKIKMVQEVV